MSGVGVGTVTLHTPLSLRDMATEPGMNCPVSDTDDALGAATRNTIESPRMTGEFMTSRNARGSAALAWSDNMAAPKSRELSFIIKCSYGGLFGYVKS